MKARIARLLDDLLAGENSDGLYRFVRDGKRENLAQILHDLEQRLPSAEATNALIWFCSTLLATRNERGSDAVRKRDRLAAEIMGRSVSG